MKKQDDILTLQETEHLCSLYMDCNLSVLEETELRYFLSQVDYHSSLIDEVRQIMDIDTYFSGKNFHKNNYDRHLKIRKWPAVASIAASVAVLIGIGLFSRPSSSNDSVESQSYYIAYVDGQRLNDGTARLRVEAEKRSVDDFIKKMSELEASKQQKIDNFFNP